MYALINFLDQYVGEGDGYLQCLDGEGLMFIKKKWYT